MKREQFLAALACSACADALGDKFEFQTRIEPESVLAHINGKSKLEVTDDSQMTYFGMRALYTKFQHPNMKFSDLIKDEYINWYRTQEGEPASPNISRMIPQEFYKRKAPGAACMNSMRSLFGNKGRRPKNASRGCGSVMRILPFASGLLSTEEALSFALISAGITHDHPENTGAVVEYMAFAQKCVVHGQYAKTAPARVMAAKRITDLGFGFYAQEAVDMAIWAVMHSDNYEELLLNSICHDGDSDSVGAIAGGLWGLMTKEMPPAALLRRVTEWPAIRDMGLDLLNVSGN